MKAFANLNQEGQAKRSRHCAIGCIVIAVIILCLVVYGNVSAARKEALCKSETTGTIYSTHSGRYTDPGVSAKFRIGNTIYYAEGRGYYSYSKVGESVPVYYYEKDPSISYTGKGARRPSAIWYYIAAVFIAGCPLFLKQAKYIEKTGRIE